MANWTHIIKSVSLASSTYICGLYFAQTSTNVTLVSLANYADADYENTDNPPLPETLVRLRIAEDEVSDLADGKDVADDDE